MNTLLLNIFKNQNPLNPPLKKGEKKSDIRIHPLKKGENKFLLVPKGYLWNEITKEYNSKGSPLESVNKKWEYKFNIGVRFNSPFFKGGFSGFFRITIILSLLFFSILITSCSDPLGIENNLRVTYKKPNILIPLEIGNEWTYRITYYDSTGLEIAIKKITIDVTEEIKNNEDSWYSTNDSLKILTDGILSNREDGLWFMCNDSLKQEYKAFPYPVSVGDEININILNKNFGFPAYILRKILAINEKIDVEAGSFNCIKYWDVLKKNNGDTMYNPFAVYYFSPKVGLIKSIHYEITNIGTIYSFKKIELIEIKLK